MKEDFCLAGMHPTFYHPFVSNLIPHLPNKVILDLGCGKGIWGFLTRAQRDTRGSKFIGFELNPAYITFVKSHNLYDKVIKGDLTKPLPFKDKSIDFIICSEVIEHMTKQQGEKLLEEIDRIMKPGGRVIITTPNVWLKMPFGDYTDMHHSLWSAKDLARYGYNVRGIGVKIPFNIIAWYTPIIQALYFVMTPISYLIPSLSGLLVATKDY